ncbi:MULTISPECIES: hypothetical protein [Snodgrassella]|uniref:Uncharacterized protein n=2 Tax=Gilliamella apicola TaxID=1196095 RepID=A0A2V4DRB6_9GAMM|nr:MULTISPECIES: hypothetical protein [Snodgrassella]KES11282.1 hypothetical protein SASC598O11_007200 [Snodgrassella alvi SCGC AB-598-O11]KES12745.1 hypothetical protein SASC598P14_004270 [Snodgrassella alvi SCGC AB-598-P14]KES15535.1 hypothetical protein GASC598I20_004970 [Gilliamella apicola SCGC AB-598-I20]PXZ01418.1 hypothetical protein DKK79_14335 [Gilliamella apicola]MBI0068048.1 hypothetical protein [Snodgrassella sp. M0110]
MLLKLENSKVPMKLVYLLSEELKDNPEQIVMTQSLTLDKSRPNMGLKGTNGLFGSKEWWNSIKQGKMPLLHVSGVITRTYVAGQDPSSVDNAFSLLLDDGSEVEESIYNYINYKDKKLFQKGAKVEIIYAYDELKRRNHNGEKAYLDIVLEMAVSLEPVE